MSGLYMSAFDVEPRTVTAVLDFFATIKAFNVEWAPRGAAHHASLLVARTSVPRLMTFLSATKGIHNVVWPVPAQEVKRTSNTTDVINLAGKKQVTTDDLRAALVAAGRSPGSVNYLAKALREAGMIKYHDGRTTTGIYDVIRASKKKAPKKSNAKKGK